MSTTTTCGVCLDECGEKNIAITECGHKTHIECLIRVLSTSDNCIYCRKKLNLQYKEQKAHQFNNDVIARQIVRTDNVHEHEYEHERENVLERCYKLSLHAIQVFTCILIVMIMLTFLSIMARDKHKYLNLSLNK